MTRSIVTKFAALATGIALIFTGISAFTAVQSAQAVNQTGYAGNVDIPDPTLVPNYLIGTEPVMAVLSDGSVVVGSKPHDWGVGQGMTKPLIKFNKDGSYDATFDENYGDISYQGHNDGVVSAIAVDDQDNIYIGGTFITLNGDGAVNIAKLAPNGTPDTGPFYLAELDGFDRPVSSMVYADGYLTIGGQFNQYLSQPVDHVVRIDRDGNPDQIFDNNLLATAAAAGVQPGFDVPTLAVTPSGETVLMLNMNAQEPNGNNYQLLRVDASGNYDAAFGGNNGIIGAPTGIAVVNSGSDPLNHSTESYLISGAPRGYSGRMLGATENGFVKVSYDGIFDDPFTNAWSLSSSFLTGGTGFENIRSMAVQPNGRIIAIGATSTGDTYIFRLLPDGTVDQTWNPDNIYVKTGSVSSLELSPAGDSVFVAGDFQDLFGNADPNFTRLSTAASFNVFLDPNDGVTLPPFPSFITDADGSFATPAGITRPGYTFDGWLDQPVGIMLTGPRYAPTYGGDITLTAQWTATSQHVTYLNGGGSGTLPTQPDTATGSHFFLGANNLSRPGYTFNGWSDGTNIWAPLSDYAMGPFDVIFTADWVPTSQHVTYADGGGAGAVPTQSDVATNATFTVASNTLNKPGFTFAGWSDGSTTYQPGTTYTMGPSDATLTALWSGTPHHVTYTNGGGSGVVPTQSDVATGAGFTVAANTLNLSGYHFGGWWDGTQLYQPGDTYILGNNDVSLSAYFVQNIYHVVYAKGGGSGTVPNQSDVATSNTFIVAANPLNRAGYSFVGWSDGTVIYQPSDTYTVGSSDVTLTAVWSANQHHIVYLNGGGSGAVPTQSDVATDGTFPLAGNSLARPGYSFDGWFDGSTLYQPGDVYTVGAADVTLTARWTASPHHITYLNGNSSATGTAPTQGDVATDSAFVVAANPFNLAGFTFVGWTDGTATSQPGDTYFVGTQDVTLTATWILTVHHVTYDNAVPFGALPTQADVAPGHTFVVAANSVFLPGFVFTGWTDGTSTYQAGDTYTMGNSDVTLTATYGGTPRHVTYLNGGGTGILPTQADVPSGSTFVLGPNNLSRPGYTFAGWWDLTVFLGTPLYQPGDIYTVGNSNVSLIAYWYPTLQHVTYLDGGGSGAVPTQADVPTDANFAVKANTLNRPGYTFAGWTDNGINLYQAADSITMGISDITLTAVWTPNNLVVTYDTQGGSPVSNGSMTVGQSIASSPANPIQAGYTFNGWFITPLGGSPVTFPYAGIQTNDFTLYAQWTPNNLVVTYDSQGGSTVANGSMTVGQSIASGPADPIQAGYTFNGWFITPSGGSPVTFPYAGIQTNDFTLYAQWTPNNLVVTYDTQGGSTVANGSMTVGQSIASAPVAPNKIGYNFAGWFITQSGGLPITFPYAGNQTNDFTLYAQWTGTSQHVTYLDGGGLGSVPTQSDVQTGNIFQLAPTSLYKPGFSFAGWSDGIAANPYVPGFNYSMGVNDVTLTAVWSPTYQHVTYADGGGSGPLPTQADVLTGDTFVVQANALLNPGFSFSGWSDGLALNPFMPGYIYTMGANDVTLTATWAQTSQHVTYVLGGASGFVPIQTDVYANNFFQVGNASSMFWAGHTFVGWFDGSSLVLPGSPYNVGNQDVTFIAQWTANNLVVTFNSQGGSPVANGSMTVGQSIASAPVAPVLAGSTFNGWFTAASGGSAISFPYAGAQTSDFTLYAQWTPIASNGGSGSSGPVTVTGIFDSQGGSNVDPVVFVSGQPVIALPSPVREGYAFAGWFTQPNAGDPVTPGYVFGLGDVTLYARWNPNANPIVFDSLGGPTVPDGTYLTGQPVGKLPAPTRDGFIFLGWLTTDDKSTTVDETYRPSSLHGIKLKAQWLDRHNQFKVRHLVAFNGASSATSATQLFKLTKFKSRLNGMSTIITQVQVWADKSIADADAQAYAIAKGKAVGALVTKSLKIKSKIVILPVLRSKGYQARHSWADVNVQFLK